MFAAILVLATSWSTRGEVVFTESIIQIKIDSVFSLKRIAGYMTERAFFGGWGGGDEMVPDV